MAKDQRTPTAPAPRPFQPTGDYILAVVLAWLIPGAGHWILGWRARAVAFAVLLLGTFWWGEVGAKGYAVTKKEHDIFFLAQIGNGMSTIFANGLQWGDVPAVPPDREIDSAIPHFLTMGILLTSVSGLLNMLLVLHVMDPRTWEAREAGPPGLDRERKP